MIQWLHRYIFRSTRLLVWGWIIFGLYMALQSSPWGQNVRARHGVTPSGDARTASPHSADKQ